MKQCTHQQCQLRLKDIDVKADRKIAPLMTFLWKAGLQPEGCEDCQGRVLISFHRIKDAEDFLDAVADYPHEDDFEFVEYPESVYGRVRQFGSSSDWRFEGFVEDASIKVKCDMQACPRYEEGDEEDENAYWLKVMGPPALYIGINIYIPQEDLEWVTARMKRRWSDIRQRRCEEGDTVAQYRRRIPGSYTASNRCRKANA
jgi:hypothetical protein